MKKVFKFVKMESGNEEMRKWEMGEMKNENVKMENGKMGKMKNEKWGHENENGVSHHLKMGS